MKADGIQSHEDQPSYEENLDERKKGFVPGLLVGGPQSEPFLQQGWVMPRQPGKEDDGKTEEEHQEDPGGKPGEGAGGKEERQAEHSKDQGDESEQSQNE